MPNRAMFKIAYGGPAVDSGTMDVRELAPALLALGDLIDDSNKVIGDPQAQIKVVVRSSFEKGSFKIILEVMYTLSQQLKMIFDLKTATDPAEIILIYLGLATGAGMSLLGLLKCLRGRPVKNATILDNGKVRIEVCGEESGYEYIEIDENVAKLYRDLPVRENLAKVLAPLEREGIDRFSVREGEVEIESVSKSEIPYYYIPDVPQDEVTSTRRALVNLVEIAFEEGLKWRLSDGDSKFYATISDYDFISQMDAGKAFVKGDVLEVELRTTQIATPKGIKNDHTIIKVLDHLSRSQQLSLPFEGEGDS